MSQALLSPDAAPVSESASTSAHEATAHEATAHETSVVVHDNATHMQSATHSPNGDVAPIDAVSTSSENSWFDFTFEASSDEQRFNLMCYTLTVLVWVYTFSACTNFYSSFYPLTLHNNATQPYVSVDSLLMSTNIMSIDISSAIFIIGGFLGTYMYHNMREEEFKELLKIVVVYTFVDLWLSTGMTLVFGGIYHLLTASFQLKDAVLTLLQGLSGLHLFSWSQDKHKWHSWNPASWPVGSLVYSFIILKFTVKANLHLRKCHERSGPSLVMLNAVLPIFILSLFALLRDDTNIFYANATNLGYRLLEFNLGAALYCTLQSHAKFFMAFLQLLNQCSPLILFGFVLIWFSELGVPVHRASHTCIRMYSFSPCIQAHHGFLMRGCLLGLTLLSRTVAVEQVTQPLPSCMCLPTPLKHRHIAPLVSVVVFVWPCCYIISLLLEINFSQQTMHENAALLLFVTPNLVFLLAFGWNAKLKPKVFDAVDATLDVIGARFRAWRSTRG